MTAEPSGLQLDLLTLLGRLQQIRDEGYEEGHWLLDRVITCDLPRCWEYLDKETIDWMHEQLAQL